MAASQVMVETPVPELPFHLKKTVDYSRMREVTGKLPMETSWEQLWKEGVIPWDAQGVTPVIAHLLKTNQIHNGRALVPGCGTGYDVVAMGNPDRIVTGLDISSTALQQAQLMAEKSPNAEYVHFLNTDFFSFAPQHKFNLIFDYTFFCAIDPSLRARWAEKMAELLLEDGELLTLVFPLDDHDGGPPFTVSLEAYKKVLSPHGFHLMSFEDDIPSVPGRKGLEKLARWKKIVDSKA